MPHWKRNLVVLGVVQTLTMVAFSSYFSLVPYYLLELGAGGTAQATAWTAIYGTGSALAMMISAPMWGSLGDRRGRKLMLTRATLSGTVTICVLYFVRSPAQLVTVRIVQGFFGGTIAAATTLVATETPEQHLGASLGILLMLQSAARAVGPLLGGITADALGLRMVFPISAVMTFLAFLSAVLLVRERAPVRAPKRDRPGLRLGHEMLGAVTGRSVLGLLVVRGILGFAITVLSPVLSLYILSLSPDSQRIATLAGAVSSAAALTTSVSALLMGRLADRVGPKTMLVVCGLGVALTYVPQALVRSPTQLLVMRAIQGIFAGGIALTTMALLTRSSQPSRRGTVFGLAASARAGGRAIGPLVGAASANAWGMPSVFLVTAGAYGLMALMVSVLVRPQAEPVSMTVEETAVPIASESETAGVHPRCGS